MKRNAVLMGIIVSISSLSLKTSAEITLTVAEIFSQRRANTQELVMFAALVKERSHGEIMLSVQQSDLFGKSEKDVLDKLRGGDVDMARMSLASLKSFEAAFEVLELPYIWNSPESMRTILNGETGQKLLSALEKEKVYGLAYYETGARSFYTTHQAITALVDLNGLTFGIAKNQMLSDFITTLGATPILMAFTEIYAAMDKGIIDGAENTWVAYESTGHYEVARYYTLDQHTNIPEVLVGSKIAFDKKLTPEQIGLLKQAAQDAQQEGVQHWNKRVEASRKIVLANGNIITELTSEARQEMRQAIQPLYEKYGAKHKSLIEEIQAQQTLKR